MRFKAGRRFGTQPERQESSFVPILLCIFALALDCHGLSTLIRCEYWYAPPLASLGRLSSLATLGTGHRNAFRRHIIESLLNVLAVLLIHAVATAELSCVEQCGWRAEALQVIPIAHWRLDLADAKR
jgi:hypothetical protein